MAHGCMALAYLIFSSNQIFQIKTELINEQYYTLTQKKRRWQILLFDKVEGRLARQIFFRDKCEKEKENKRWEEVGWLKDLFADNQGKENFN